MPNVSRIEVIAFDADDTLWHNERYYVEAQIRFTQLLSHYHKPEWINERLYQTETDNIQHFGYGIKAFALSMIETAVELTEGRISGKDIQVLIDLAKEMLGAAVQLLDHIAETIPQLAKDYRLMVITKGDLLDQERKLKKSGLETYFHHIEIMSEKGDADFIKLIRHLDIPPEEFIMIGNSIKSDILPVLNIGGHGIHIPYHITWEHEKVETSVDHPRFRQVEKITDVLQFL